MKLDDARKHYYDHSGTASSVARQLAFAGIALIWIFREQGFVIAANLAAPAALFVAALGFDVLEIAKKALARLISWGRGRCLPEAAEPIAKIATEQSEGRSGRGRAAMAARAAAKGGRQRTRAAACGSIPDNGGANAANSLPPA